MLKVFQKMFVDPMDHLPLIFDGELSHECWYDGRLHSSGGKTWAVKEGIPNFLCNADSGWSEKISQTETRVKKLLSNGTYKQNWWNGRGVLGETNQNSPFAEACQDILDHGVPVVDIGSGPGGGFMPSLLALNPGCVVMVTDILVPIVHGWREFLYSSEISHSVCFAAFDAMEMPIAAGSAKAITSNAGFSSVSKPLLAFREAARILADDGVIYAGEASIETEGLKMLSSKMGWDFEKKFGDRIDMSRREIFDVCGLQVLKEKHYFRRKMRPDDNEVARTAHKMDVDLWLGGNLYWLTKTV